MQESLQQQAEQVTSLLEEADQHKLPASLIHQATQLQSELDSVLGDVRSHCTELKSCIDLQQHYEWLVHSLKQLLSLGSERISQQPEMELHSRAQLQQQFYSHTKFFHFLGLHLHILQYLTERMAFNAPMRWEGVMAALEDEVARLQHQGLEKGIRMHHTLQMWTQWEEDSIWSESVLGSIETSFPKMKEGGDYEKQVSQNLSIYKVIFL
ncbi:hypothetical protein AMECASPLE_032904 [Ameca splendens]|uniref:Uncharacterized protein n=1 Tax=Ameca splendens TaxID=208324 RepID=A0ABV0XVI7_9TELE